MWVWKLSPKEEMGKGGWYCVNPIQDEEPKKAPYQFLPCNFYKLKNNP